MLFNSYIFIFLFLPLTVLGFHVIGSQGHRRAAIAWLVGASLFFYGWWNPAYLALISSSMIFNYVIGMTLNQIKRRFILIFGIAANLSLLGYYKYVNFFIDNINALFSTNLVLEKIILPLAISFFTFQQIAYLVDTYRGKTVEHSFLQYCFFVVFFPQLIAGPIVHHLEILPQFARNTIYRINTTNLSVGITIFAIGLFKKAVLADSIADYATPVFDATEIGVQLTFFEAWGGALAYTFQLYFDFSGYSDMAVGLARMFGVRLPPNFNSPYKATSIIDFWRHWHITLSRFLRDYLYIPMGGNRKGTICRYLNIFVTMLLGGIWHGAGWTFALWGALHGLYLIINHIWRHISEKLGWRGSSVLGNLAGWTITMFMVILAWVLFRATTLEGAGSILAAMMGANGLSLPASLSEHFRNIDPWFLTHGIVFNGMFHNGLAEWKYGVFWLVVLFIIAVAAPNTQQFTRRYQPVLKIYPIEVKRLPFRALEWRASILWAVMTGIVLAISLTFIQGESEFLYYQF